VGDYAEMFGFITATTAVVDANQTYFQGSLVRPA
jgi:hypothetical protein